MPLLALPAPSSRGHLRAAIRETHGMASPGGIITLQLGRYANFVGAHYWNVQARAPRAHRRSVTLPTSLAPHCSFTYAPHCLLKRRDSHLGVASRHPAPSSAASRGVSVASPASPATAKAESFPTNAASVAAEGCCAARRRLVRRRTRRWAISVTLISAGRPPSSWRGSCSLMLPMFDPASSSSTTAAALGVRPRLPPQRDSPMNFAS